MIAGEKKTSWRGIREAFPAADQQPAWAGLTAGFHWAMDPLSFWGTAIPGNVMFHKGKGCCCLMLQTTLPSLQTAAVQG